MLFRIKKQCYRFIILCIVLAPFLHPTESHALKDNSPDSNIPIDGDIRIGGGYESNIFLSGTHKQSDTFFLFESSLSHLFQPSNKSILLTLFNGSHQRYLDLDQANSTFANLTSYFRLKTSPFVSAGFTNTFSYTDLKLLDTEGGALPIGQFQGMSDQLRLYGLYSYNEYLRFELGVFYQLFDVEEIGGQSSLDYQKKGLDLSSRISIAEDQTMYVTYKLEQYQYDDRQAGNRTTSFDGISNPFNPRLELRRQDLSIKYKNQFETDQYFKLTAKYRINDDLFEDHLSYRHAELQASLEKLDLHFLDLSFDLTYRDRRYTDRRNTLSSNTHLKESFLITYLKLSKKIGNWLSASISHEFTKKTSNGTDESYKNHQNMLSFEAIW